MSKVKEANIPEFRVSVMLAGSFAGYRVMNDNAYDNIVAYSLINAEESSFSTSSINANERIEKKRIEIFGE